MKKLTFTISIILAFLWLDHSRCHAQDTLVYRYADRQDTTAAIQCVATYTGEAVILRWAPSDETAWLQLNTNGYMVRRTTMDPTGIPQSSTKKEWHVNPWPMAEFEKKKDQLSDYLLVAAQCLYGAYESAATPGINLHGYQQEINNRFGMALLSADLDPEAALALGLRYEDLAVSPDALYLYEVYPADTMHAIRHGATLLPTRKTDLPAPVIETIEEEEGHVVVKWKKAGHEEYFTAYQVEISDDGKKYRPASDLPILGGESSTYPSAYISFRYAMDNYRPLYFRIKGITPFGQWSSPSTALRGQARDKTPTAAPSSVLLNTDALSGQIRITWKDPEEKDFSAIEIHASYAFNGPYQIVPQGNIKKKVQYFEEIQSDTRSIWYYKLAAVDTAGNKQFTRVYQAAFRDTIAPATPTMITGTIDSLGVVRLSWAANTEPDLEGYQVYMANQADHIFTNMTPYPLAEARWQDTISLKTFTEEIFYRVAAVDFHSHVSAWSEPVRLVKPDTLRPMPPSFSGYRVEKDHILLRMEPGKSKDIVAYELKRKNAKESTWSIVQPFDISKGIYLDDDVIAGDTYEYQLTSIDDAGLTCAYPAHISIKCVDRNKPEAPEILTCTLQETAIHLIWEQPEPGTHTIIVYRAVNGGPFTTLATLQEQLTYTDKNIDKSKTYAYKLKSTWQDGQRSAFSALATPFIR